MLATGVGPIPAEYGLPQPRVTHGDRAVVRNGQLSAEAVRAPQPERPFIWGVPDLHFLKVLAMCLMAFAAVMVLVRDRIEDLRLAKMIVEPETDIFIPRPARWSGHSGFTHSARHDTVIASKDLERIKGFSSKVKALKDAERFAAPRSAGILAALAEPIELEGNGAFGGLRGSGVLGVIGGVPGGTVGGVVSGEVRGLGGLGTRGSGFGSGGGGTGLGVGGLGSIGISMSSRRRTSLRYASSGDEVLAEASSDLGECLREYDGPVNATLELFDDGRVRSATVTGPDEAPSRCVARTLEQLQFNAGTEQVMARWTVN